MKNISAQSIRNPIPSILLFVVLTIFGIVAFFRLPINQNPSQNIPLVSISVSQAGAASSEIETGIIRKIESAVTGLIGVKQVSTVISTGVSITTVEFTMETPTDRALSDVRDAVSRIRSDLPRGIDEPSVSRIDADGSAFAIYAIESASFNPQDLAWFIDDVVARHLRAVNGVARVARKGGVNREILVALDPTRLEALGITADEVSGQLRASNVDLPSGRSEANSRNQAIRTIGSVTSLEDMRQMRIVLPRGGSTRLSDVATITDGAAAAQQLALLDGKPAVAFEVVRAKGTSEVSVAAAVTAAIAQLQAERPEVKISLITSSVSDTVESYYASLKELVVGVVLAALVVFLFLGDWRATLIALSDDPDFCGDICQRLHAECHELAWANAGGRYPRRRRNSRDREYCAPRRHG
jgi:multidrug efflux pump subunit AcrB